MRGFPMMGGATVAGAGRTDGDGKGLWEIRLQQKDKKRAAYAFHSASVPISTDPLKFLVSGRPPQPVPPNKYHVSHTCSQQQEADRNGFR